jgi:hypothetical protein
MPGHPKYDTERAHYKADCKTANVDFTGQVQWIGKIV